MEGGPAGPSRGRGCLDPGVTGMSGLNSQINRVVWCDVPVVDLDRAISFYSAVLKIKVQRETFGEFTFAVLAHMDGNGGCLVIKPNEVSSTAGPLVYFNVDGRLA